ncbi:transcription antiterminator BglG [Bacilli bacterium]|nr:transcription antiterminator BglG [Bacilli bacterium]
MIRQAINLTENDRQALAILMISAELEDISVYHLQDALLVSRGTVLTDIKKIQKYAQENGLVFKYSRQAGYRFYGDERRIRQLVQKSILVLLCQPATKALMVNLLNQFSDDFHLRVMTDIRQFLESHRLTVVPSRLEETIYFLAFVIIRSSSHPIVLTDKEIGMLEPLIIKQKVVELVNCFPTIIDAKAETSYFSMVLMGMIQAKVREYGTEFLYDCSYEICRKVEHLTGIEFKAFTSVVDHIYAHLVPAYFRILGKFTIQNVLIEQIQKQYNHLFQLTQYSLTTLEDLLGEKLPESEVGYFTILFGGEIANLTERPEDKRYRALVVCPSGMSSSLIMRSELATLFPMIDFIEAKSFFELDLIPLDDYDLIFSSVALVTQKPLYIIPPILSMVDKVELLRKVQRELLLPSVVVPSVTDILATILPYVTLKEGVTQEKIKKLVTKKMMKQLKKKGDESPMLSELLTPDKIRFNHETPAPTWQEAIRLAGAPLVENDAIEPRYLDAMIQKVLDFGPFIHLGFGIALPHARPEDGVKNLAMSLLKFSEPVYLLDDEKHPIRIFICLAAVDNDTHLRALSSLTKILTDKTAVQRLLEAETTEEIVTLIQEGEE